MELTANVKTFDVNTAIICKFGLIWKNLNAQNNCKESCISRYISVHNSKFNCYEINNFLDVIGDVNTNLTTLYDMLMKMSHQLETVTGNLERVTKELEEMKKKLNQTEEKLKIGK